MTSEGPAKCFVSVTLPRQTEPVTAGRLALAIDRRGTPEGRFAHGRGVLERQNAVALDPVSQSSRPVFGQKRHLAAPSALCAKRARTAGPAA